MEQLLKLLALAVVAVILFILIRVVLKHLIARVEIKEGERAVLYRFGRFHRILKPGWQWIIPILERIERRFVVRNEPRSYYLSDLFVGGVPLNLTLSAWTWFDPQEAYERRRIKRATLAHILLFNEHERNRQVEWKIRDVFIKRLGEMEAEMNMTENDIGEKLLPIIPGTPANKTLLERVKQDLAQALPSSLGVFLDTSQSLIVQSIEAPSEIMGGFSLNRLFTLLDKAMPGLSNQEKMHIAAAFKGWGNIKRDDLIIDGGAGVGVRKRGDEIETRVYVGETRASEYNEGPSQSADMPTEGSEHYEWLSDADLSYLKRLPPSS